jgi:hypothetical protein
MQVVDRNGRLKVEITNAVDELTVGVTNIVGGVSGRALYDNAGVLGELDLASTYVPLSRTLTINGTTQDLSANRTFTVSTGITIGTTAITSGTVGRVLFEGTGNVVQESAGLTYNDTTKTFTLSGNQNASTSLIISNTTSGSTAQSALLLNSTAGIYKYSASTTPYKIFASNDFGHYNGIIGDISILNDVANGKIKFATNQSNTPQMTLAATGNVLINTTTDAGFKLDVNGATRIGATGSVDALTINYSSQSLRFYNDGSANPIYLIQSSSTSKLTIGYTFNYYFSFDHARKSVCIDSDSGASAPQANASAVLDLKATTKGFLPPRMTTTQKNAIASPATGLMVYDTTLNVITYYNGTTWI